MQTPDDQTKQISLRCREAREQAGLTQAQAAKHLQMLRPSLSEAEAGRRKISATELTQMAKLYSVSLDWLAAQDTEKPTPEQQKIQVAARELSKLKPADLEAVMQVVKSMGARRGDKS